MKQTWSIEKIKEGFKKFETEYGRLPTAPEIDKLDYLPSSRHIQMAFGGLQKLRGLLGYEDTHFGKGEYRSEIAKKSNTRGRETEVILEKILKNKFGEVFVHTEKVFGDVKNRMDFYIYAPEGNFGIDVFYTETMKDLQKNINLKIDKYKDFPELLYFVVGNSKFTQSDLNAYTLAKQKALGKKAQIVSLLEIQELIKPMSVYPNPLILK